jgi:N-acetylneuraminate synthase
MSTFTAYPRTKLIAEIGLSHEGSLGNALNLATASIRSGADVVKFQCHLPEYESSEREEFRVAFSNQDISRWHYWLRTSFTFEQWQQIKSHVENLGGIFGVSVFSGVALEQMIALGTEFIKLGSGDLRNDELIEGLQNYNGDVVLSSGMATWAEISKASEWLKSAKVGAGSAILQCTSKYPTDLSEVGLNVMQQISQNLEVNTGLSDHTRGISSSIAAISLGAYYVEKHVVYSKEMFGPDVESSITFEELRSLSDYRDDFQKLKNKVNKDEVSLEFQDLRTKFGRSLGLKRNFASGEKPLIQDFCLRKPGGGISWAERFDFVEKELSVEYKAFELLTYDHFVRSDISK